MKDITQLCLDRVLYSDNSDFHILWQRVHREKNKDSINTKSRVLNKKYREKLKYEILSYYSNGIPNCGCCGESEYEFLTIDHINGKKSMNHDNSMAGYKLLIWIKKHNFPKGFRILCWNCNGVLGKRNNVNKICPHKTEQSDWEGEL